MSKKPDPHNATRNLAKVSAARLVAARKALGLSQGDLARELHYNGVAHVSEIESGEKLLRLDQAVVLAKFMGVSLDYLCGLHDDPVADPLESNSSLFNHIVANTVRAGFDQFVEAQASYATAIAEGLAQDRLTLNRVSALVDQLDDSMVQLRRLNPTFDEDLRGSARVVRCMANLKDELRAHATRKRIHDRFQDEEGKAARLVKLQRAAQQLFLDLDL